MSKSTFALPIALIDKVKVVSEMPSGEWEQVASVLDDYRSTQTRARLADDLSRSGFGPDLASDLVGTFFALHDIARYLRINEPEEVLDAIELSDDALFGPGEERLLDVLENRAIYARLKADSLHVEYDSVFRGCQVTTDLRPIFDGSGLDVGAPTGFLVSHLLRVDFERTDLESIYLSLDRNDLLLLKHVVERALNKDDITRRVGEAAGLPDLSPSEAIE